MYEILIV